MASFSFPDKFEISGAQYIRTKGTKGIVLESGENFYLNNAKFRFTNDSGTNVSAQNTPVLFLNDAERTGNVQNPKQVISNHPFIQITDFNSVSNKHPLLQLVSQNATEPQTTIFQIQSPFGATSIMAHLLLWGGQGTGLYINYPEDGGDYGDLELAGIKIDITGFHNTNPVRGIDIDIARGQGIKINVNPQAVDLGSNYDSFGFYGELQSSFRSTGSSFFKINIPDSYQNSSESGQSIILIQAEENSQIKIPLLKLKNNGAINGYSGIMEIEVGTQGKIKSFHQRNTDTEILDNAQPTPTHIGQSISMSGQSFLPLMIKHKDLTNVLTQPTIYLDLQGTGSNAIWIHRGDSFIGRGNGNAAFIKFDDSDTASGVAFFEGQSYLQLPPNPNSSVALTAVSGRLYFYNGSTWQRLSEDIL